MSDDEFFPPTPVDAQALDPRTIEQMVQNQSRELEIRARELDLQQQEDRHNFEFSKAALDAQTKDRSDARRFKSGQRRNAYLLAGWLSVCVFSCIALAMWFNKDQVALEIIKSIVLLLSGGSAGYAIGHHQGRKPSPTNASDP